MKLGQTIAKEFIASILVEPLLHGDAAHREWLTAELRKQEGNLAARIENGIWKAARIGRPSE